ncbi:UvrD-helicase domain-containing protein, partial [Planctomycetota bacterium]
MNLRPNPGQQDLIDRTDGVFVVDAGAGTGKTAAITRRYQRLLEKASPEKILLLTFTNNAAENMRERIINACTGTHSPKELVEAPIATFHSYAHRLLSMHGFNAPAYLGIPETLPPGFRVMESDVFEKHLFRRFFHDFQPRHSEHADTFQGLGADTDSLFGLIRQLCCKGIFPSRDGWCINGKALLAGDREGFMQHFEYINTPIPGSRSAKASPCLSSFRDKLSGKTYQTDLDPVDNRISLNPGEDMPLFTPNQVNPALAGPAWDENRDALFSCVHDVYFEYIQYSLRSGRINFDLLLMFTFVLLYHNHGLRQAIAFEYVMVDEFQDTNEIQFQLVLLLMKQSNLCVVGDWKQGIYSFRHASISNILEFDEHLEHYREILNQDYERIPFQLKAEHKEFDINYRSSQTILDFSEKALLAPGNRTEQIDPAIRKDITALKADHSLDDATAIRFLQTDNDEYDLVLDSINALISNPDCRVKSREDDGSYSERPVRLSDIAVFTRTRQFGLELQETALERGIPVNYDGGIELFRTRPALLLLAWLRVILNGHHREGWITILEEAG